MPCGYDYNIIVLCILRQISHDCRGCHLLWQLSVIIREYFEIQWITVNLPDDQPKADPKMAVLLMADPAAKSAKQLVTL